MNPEGIVELPIAPWTAASQVQLISDNGTTIFYGDGIEAKHLAIPSFKKFRSDWVSFGAVTVSQPLIRSITLSGHNLIVSWCTVPGRTYRVQYKAQLKDPAWIDLTGDVLATEAIAMKIIPIGTAPQRFYHVALLP